MLGVRCRRARFGAGDEDDLGIRVASANASGDDHGAAELSLDRGRHVRTEEAGEEPVVVLAEDDDVGPGVARRVDDRPSRLTRSPHEVGRQTRGLDLLTRLREQPDQLGRRRDRLTQSAMSSRVPKNRSTWGSSGTSKTESTTRRAFLALASTMPRSSARPAAAESSKPTRTRLTGGSLRTATTLPPAPAPTHSVQGFAPGPSCDRAPRTGCECPVPTVADEFCAHVASYRR